MEQIYQRLEDASQLRFLDGRSRVIDEATYLAWHAERITDRGIVAARHFREVQLEAFVNHGRWLTGCTYCFQAMFTHPVWRLACCAECGAAYRGVAFPDRLAEITRLLLVRPKRENQNWHPGESVFALRAENLLHGLWS